MWIVIEAFALFGLIAAVKFLGYLGLFLGTIFFFAVTLPNVARRLSKTRLATRFYENTAYYDKKCSYCTGGAQTLHNDGTWGKIPVHLRIYGNGTKMFGPPRGNVRSCPHCNGLGRTPAKHSGVESHGRIERPWPPEDGIPYAADPFYDDDPDRDDA